MSLMKMNKKNWIAFGIVSAMGAAALPQVGLTRTLAEHDMSRFYLQRLKKGERGSSQIVRAVDGIQLMISGKSAETLFDLMQDVKTVAHPETFDVTRENKGFKCKRGLVVRVKNPKWRTKSGVRLELETACVVAIGPQRNVDVSKTDLALESALQIRMADQFLEGSPEGSKPLQREAFQPVLNADQFFKGSLELLKLYDLVANSRVVAGVEQFLDLSTLKGLLDKHDDSFATILKEFDVDLIPYVIPRVEAVKLHQKLAAEQEKSGEQPKEEGKSKAARP